MEDKSNSRQKEASKVMMDFLDGVSGHSDKTIGVSFLEQAFLLLGSSPQVSKDVTERCAELVKLQRIHENTRARQRLEKWTTRIIVWYLIFVAMFLLAYSAIRFVWGVCVVSDVVIVTLLSSTTVTIIGLPLILLKGHFPNADNERTKND